MTAREATYRPEAEAGYADNYAYLADELRKLDSLLHLRAAAFGRTRQAESEASGQHLYVTPEEVDTVLRDGAASPSALSGDASRREAVNDLQGAIDAKAAESRTQGVFLPLRHLARLFDLSLFEVQVILICLAPELRRTYDRVYAYLQDDITRKRPSVDLVLDVLCDTEAEKWVARALLAPGAALRRTGMIRVVEDPHSPSGSSGLAQFLQLEPRILHFLLGHPVIEPRLTGLVQLRRASSSADELAVDPSIKTALSVFARRHFFGETDGYPRWVVHLHGPRGVGKRDVALAVCEALQCSLLCFDAAHLSTVDDEAEILRLALRESALLQAPLYLASADVWLGDDEQATVRRSALARAVEAYGGLVFLGGEKPWPHRGLFEATRFYAAALPMPEVPVREAAWRQALKSLTSSTLADRLAARLADRFRLTPGQIREAVTTLADRRTVNDEAPVVTFESLAAVCRTQSHHRLGALATRIDPHYTWDDLVLPDDKRAQLQEMCSQVRHRHQIFRQWGFGKKLAHGRGLSALFTGPPGTGKTMAAEVMAHDLQLDLYKIDLARIVSKYIGETEKNLGRIFDEAENSNAILFFDEADALFGKRTEIADAHDRYANIETSYLLQKMEEHEGVVILASNLRENMDSAFLRRIRFIVEFPFPDAASRLEIWKTHFPPEAPVSEAVDYELLAGRIQVAGGNIKNIVLGAAFFAAADGGVIGMEHLAQGTRREFEKIGKLWDEKVLTRKNQ